MKTAFVILIFASLPCFSGEHALLRLLKASTGERGLPMSPIYFGIDQDLSDPDEVRLFRYNSKTGQLIFSRVMQIKGLRSVTVYELEYPDGQSLFVSEGTAPSYFETTKAKIPLEEVDISFRSSNPNQTYGAGRQNMTLIRRMNVPGLNPLLNPRIQLSLADMFQPSVLCPFVFANY